MRVNFSFLRTNVPKVCQLFNLSNQRAKGRVAEWLATCARKPKVPGSSPAASYAQSWAPCSNLPANV